MQTRKKSLHSRKKCASRDDYASQVLNIAAAGDTIGMEKSSAENYVRLLEAAFLVQRLPAWGTTLGSRVARHPKIHIVDSGVLAWLLNLTPATIAQGDPAVLTEYGHLVETFAVGEILKQVRSRLVPESMGKICEGFGLCGTAWATGWPRRSSCTPVPQAYLHEGDVTVLPLDRLWA